VETTFFSRIFLIFHIILRQWIYYIKAMFPLCFSHSFSFILLFFHLTYLHFSIILLTPSSTFILSSHSLKYRSNSRDSS
jgi:hypothetical protein